MNHDCELTNIPLFVEEHFGQLGQIDNFGQYCFNVNRQKLILKGMSVSRLQIYMKLMRTSRRNVWPSVKYSS